MPFFRPRSSPKAAPESGRQVVFFNWRDTRHPEGGGSELYVEKVAAGLVALGHHVTVVCASYPSASPDEVRDGIRFVRRGGRHTVYLRAALCYLSGRLGRPDLLVDVQNGMPFFAAVWSRRPVVVLVHHVHREQWGVVFGPLVARFGWWAESRLAPRLNRRARYVAVSDVTRRELVGLGVRPVAIEVVHNGTAPALLSRLGRASEPRICVLGRLVPHKRVELVIAAVATLRGEFPGLRLDVVGHGYWEARLRETAERLGVADSVVFHGFVDEQTKHDLLAAAWALAMPSLKEGWGLSVVEAGTHGTPAVAFRSAGGLAESIEDGSTGLLVDAPEAYAGALRALLADAVLRRRLGAAARLRATRFTWSAATTAFAALIPGEAIPTLILPGHSVPRQRAEEPIAVER